MISDEQAALRVTRMSLAQRATWLRALEADRAKRGWSIDKRGRTAEETGARRCALPLGASAIVDHAPLASLMPLFTSDAWRSVWRPGAQFHVYVLGCTGLQGTAPVIGPKAKIGTAEVGGLDRRIGELRRDRYGSVIRTASAWRTEPGWSDWTLFPKVQLEATPPTCPIRGADQTLILTAPDGWSAGDVEALVNEALATFRLQRVAVGDAVRAICIEHGIDPDSLVRYSQTKDGYEAAKELTLVRPQADAPRVAGLIAAAMARRHRALAEDPAASIWSVLDRLHAGNAAPGVVTGASATMARRVRRPQTRCARRG